MKKTALILAALVLGSLSFRAQAQQGRFELTPMIGWRLNSDISETDVARYSQLKFEDAATFGLAMSWNTSRVTSVELEYTYASYDGTAVARTAGADRTVNIKQHDILVNGLYLFNTGNDKFRPFLLGGIGASILAPSLVRPLVRLLLLSERPYPDAVGLQARGGDPVLRLPEIFLRSRVLIERPRGRFL